MWSAVATPIYYYHCHRGVKLAKASSSPELKEECGTILEELKVLIVIVVS